MSAYGRNRKCVNSLLISHVYGLQKQKIRKHTADIVCSAGTAGNKQWLQEECTCEQEGNVYAVFYSGVVSKRRLEGK